MSTKDLEDLPDGIGPGDLAAVRIAKNMLWRQLAGLQSWIDLVEAMFAQAETIEAALGELAASRYVDSNIGAALEGIAFAFGLTRAGLDNAELRSAILAEGRSLSASGAEDEIVTILEGLVAGVEFELEPAHPAAFIIRTEALGKRRILLIQTVLADVPAAGVGVGLLVDPGDDVIGFPSSQGGSGPFGAFSSSQAATFHGFSFLSHASSL